MAKDPAEFTEFGKHINAIRAQRDEPALDDAELRALFGPYAVAAMVHQQHVVEMATVARDGALDAERDLDARHREERAVSQQNIDSTEQALEAAETAQQRWTDLADQFAPGSAEAAAASNGQVTRAEALVAEAGGGA